MNQLFLLFLTFFLLVLNPSSIDAVELTTEELPKCVVVTHCVLENWQVNDVEETFKKIVEAVVHTPRTKIVEKTPLFLHAEAQTRWMRYTDDLLVSGLPAKGLIQVRSESRVGIGDNGVNKRRVDDLAYRVTTNQID